MARTSTDGAPGVHAPGANVFPCANDNHAGAERSGVGYSGASYSGIVLARHAGADALWLEHDDPERRLFLPLADEAGAIAEWRRLSRAWGLPLLALTSAGDIVPIPDGRSGSPQTRRAARWHRRHRPRFLARRAMPRPLAG